VESRPSLRDYKFVSTLVGAEIPKKPGFYTIGGASAQIWVKTRFLPELATNTKETEFL
jgi:hypothetical protein